MNINDRVALELGRALIRGHAFEAALAEEQAKTAALLARIAETERADRPAPKRRGAAT